VSWIGDRQGVRAVPDLHAITDDFNAPRFGPPNHPPSELADRRALVNSLDPDRRTYASGGPFPGFSP
jgi:hypothetical protein